jgi:hypothetical protein
LFDSHDNTIEIKATDKRERVYYQSWIIRASAESQRLVYLYFGDFEERYRRSAAGCRAAIAPVATGIDSAQQSVTIRLEGLCSAARAGTSLSIDGKPVLKTATATASSDESIDVKRGTLAIDIEAVDANGNRRTVVIPVINQEKAVPKVRSAGNKYALVLHFTLWDGAGRAASESRGHRRKRAGIQSSGTGRLQKRKYADSAGRRCHYRSVAHRVLRLRRQSPG